LRDLNNVPSRYCTFEFLIKDSILAFIMSLILFMSSPSTLASKLNAKVGIELAGLSMDTPTAYAPNNEVSMI
jgi:hypothetical protein